MWSSFSMFGLLNNFLFNLPRICGLSFILLTFYCLASKASPGADWGHYIVWGESLISGNIFNLSDISTVVNDLGIPVSQWAPGTGVIFSFSLLLGYTYLFHWFLVIITFIFLYGILDILTSNHKPLIWFGLTIGFFATPLGYYSQSHASESASFGFLAMLFYLSLSYKKLNYYEILGLGCLYSVFIIIVPKFFFYSFPIGFYYLCKFLTDYKTYHKLILFSTPLLFALSFILLNNFWMTGSPLISPYQFGNDHIKAINFFDTEFMAVLFNPFHGLIPFHPFYILGFYSLFYLTWYSFYNNRAKLNYFLALTFIIFFSLWLVSAWYCWWAGMGSFGQRNLAHYSIIFIPIFIDFLYLRYKNNKNNSYFIILAIGSSIYSYLLYVNGLPWFSSWAQLWKLLSSTFIENFTSLDNINLIALLIIFTSTILIGLYKKNVKSIKFKEFNPLLFMGINVCSWIILAEIIPENFRLIHIHIIVNDTLKLFIFNILMFLVVLPLFFSDNKHSLLTDKFLCKSSAITGVCFYIAFIILLVPFSYKTLHSISRGHKSDLSNIKYRANYYVPDPASSSKEYFLVPGFEEKKKHLKDLMDRELLIASEKLKSEKQASKKQDYK